MPREAVSISNIRIEKLVHGGQCLSTAPDGRKLFIWGGLPGEIVDVVLTKVRRDYAEGLVTDIVEASKDRVGTLKPDDIDLSIQPWRIMSFEAESKAKRLILEEAFAREGVSLRFTDVRAYGPLESYRNKVEFSFWGDEEGLHLAHFLRATHRKVKLAYPYHPLIFEHMAARAKEILSELNGLNVRAGDLKSLVIRANHSGRAVAALFVKAKDFPKLQSTDVAVIYSDPKSPASVKTEALYTNGDITLTDTLLGKNINYDVFSFFQVNLPVFEEALKVIKEQVDGAPSVDMYSGVGAIGLGIGSDVLVETDDSSAAMALENATDTGTKVVHASSEKALEHINDEKILIVDPPRAGLHRDVIERILKVGPLKVIYLSCNPATQARDVALLQTGYEVSLNQGYNFFPRTPHIESLLVLRRVA